MFRSWRYRILAALVLLLLVIVVGVARVWIKHDRLNTAYEAIQIGD